MFLNGAMKAILKRFGSKRLLDNSSTWKALAFIIKAMMVFVQSPFSFTCSGGGGGGGGLRLMASA